MGMNRTLLDYLLNRVDEADAREFQRVLAMPVTAAPSEDELNQRFERDLEREKTGEDQRNDLNKKEYERRKWERNKKDAPKEDGSWFGKTPELPTGDPQKPPKQIDKNNLFDWISDIYGGDKQKEQNFFGKVSELLFGKRKSAFEMTPEELSRLTRVALDSKEVADFELHINPSMMKPQARQKTPQQMEHIVNDFYLKNKLYFESPDDISFDPKTSTLKYKGRKRLAKKLLKDELEVEEKVAQQTVDEVSKPVKLSIPLIDLVDTDSPEFENITKEKAAEVEKELKRLAGRNVQVEVEPGRAVASVTAAPKDRLAEREKFNQKNIQKQKAKPPSFWDQKEQEEADEPTKPGTQPSEPESQMVDPQVKVRGNKIDIYNVFKKSHLLDQQKVKEIFEGDLGKYTD